MREYVKRPKTKRLNDQKSRMTKRPNEKKINIVGQKAECLKVQIVHKAELFIGYLAI